MDDVFDGDSRYAYPDGVRKRLFSTMVNSKSPSTVEAAAERMLDEVETFVGDEQPMYLAVDVDITSYGNVELGAELTYAVEAEDERSYGTELITYGADYRGDMSPEPFHDEVDAFVADHDVVCLDLESLNADGRLFQAWAVYAEDMGL